VVNPDLVGAISAALFAELHFGVLVAERGRRAAVGVIIEATFDALSVSTARTQ